MRQTCCSPGSRHPLVLKAFSMALRQLFVPSLPTAAFFPRAIPPIRLSLCLQQLIRPILFTPVAIPIALRTSVPSLLAGIWESILRAVPKKKTSHRKKRQRFLAGKALKDVTALNKCSACGNVKRAHLLCPFCVNGRVYYYLCAFVFGLMARFQKFERCGEGKQVLRRRVRERKQRRLWHS